MINKILLPLFLISFIFANTAKAQIGSVDATFGIAGEAISLFNSDGSLEINTAILPDNRIVVAGTDFSVGISPFMELYTANGALVAFSPNLSSISEIHDVATTTDGKIIAVGQTFGNNFFVLSLNTDGSQNFFLQENFAVATSTAYGVFIMPNGKIVAVGDANGDAAILRLNSNGSLDNTFGTNGKTVLSGSAMTPSSVAVQNSGKILVFGNKINSVELYSLNADGSTNTAFGTGGLRTFAALSAVATSVAIGSFDVIYIIYNETQLINRISTIRSLNGTIGANINTNTFTANTDDELNDIAIQPDGKILVAGLASLSTITQFIVYRLLDNLIFDTSFSGDAIATYLFSGDTENTAYSIAIQSTGDIIVAGEIDQLNNPDLGLIRLNAEPILTVINTNNTGFGSFSQAITNANTNAGTDNITFNIPTSDAGYNTANGGYWSIRPTTALPAVTGTVLINGYTQTGSTFNSTSIGTNAALKIELDGSLETLIGVGLRFNATAANSSISGLCINSFLNSGVRLDASQVTVAGCFIGTDISGGIDKGNGGLGINIVNSSTNTIGGNLVTDVNIISGNANDGVGISGTSSTGNQIINNLIGTNRAASGGIPNSQFGISIDGSASNSIYYNFIAYNNNGGINIDGTAGSATNNYINSNSIFCNQNIGISLTNNGNNLQPAPVISTASTPTVLTGTCTSCADGDVVEVYLDNEACTPAQGKFVIGSTTVTASNWTLIEPNYTTSLTIAAGDRITAIISNASNNTSPFSSPVILAATPPVLAAPANTTITFTEGDAPLRISSTGLAITAGSTATISSATIAFITNYTLGQDNLNIPIVATWASVSFNVTTGVMTITGTTTPANYQAELQKIRYSNGSSAPSTLPRTIAIKVNDGTSDSNAQTITLNVVSVNEPPIITNGVGTYSTLEEAPVSFNLQAIDGDSPVLTWSVLQQPTDGNVTLNSPTGNNIIVTYTPDLNTNGLDTLIIQVTDGIGADIRVIYFQVIPLNDAPQINPITTPQPAISFGASEVIINLTGINAGGGADEASQTIVITAVSSNPNLISNPSIIYTSPNTTGTLTYRLISEPPVNTNVTITYKLKDNGGFALGNIDTTVLSFVIPVVIQSPAPTNLVASALSETSILLNWQNNAATTATGYEIQRKASSPTAGFITIATLNNAIPSTYTDTGLTLNTQYFYRVRTLTATGPTDYSNISAATTADVATAPAQLTATAINSYKIRLEWLDNSNDETGFKIERASVYSDFFFEEIYFINANVTTIIDSLSILPNTQYFYRIRATNDGGNSVYSNIAQVTTPIDPNLPVPFPPIDLEATAVSTSQIDLTWEYLIDPTVVYSIERSIDDVTFNEIDRVLFEDLIAQKTYYDTLGLQAGITYFYRVKAITGGGTSIYSDTAQAVAACNLVVAIIRNDNNSQTICAGKTASMTVSSRVFRANYQWRKNGNIIPGAVFDTFYASETGNYTCDIRVGLGATCQAPAINQILVVVLGTPTSLGINLEDDNLVASVQDAEQYQWFRNYQAIPGANNYFYKPAQSGVYFVNISVDNCSSTSDIFVFDITTGTENDISSLITIAPNPSADKVNLKADFGTMGDYEVHLVDLAGKKYLLDKSSKNAFLLEKELSISRFATGMYFLEFKIGKYIGRRKLIKY